MDRFYIIVATVICLGISIVLNANDFPTFQSPVDFEMRLSGTFGELRPGHFHAGIDIKSPNGATGHPIKSIGDGYISKIYIDPQGYGKVIYISHPSGYVSVYAHLEKFPDKVKAMVYQKQQEEKKYEVLIEPFPYDFPVTAGSTIGWMGLTGRTFGPHLHFEIRDKWSGYQMNPLAFGIGIVDQTPPSILELKVTEFDSLQNVLRERKIGRNYRIVDIASPKVGIAIKAYDRMDGVRNLNGIYEIECFEGNRRISHLKFDQLLSSESENYHSIKDLKEFKKDKAYFSRLFRLSKINHSNLVVTKDAGYLELNIGDAKNIRLVVRDFYQNESIHEVQIRRGSNAVLSKRNIPTGYTVKAEEVAEFTSGNISVAFPKHCFYDEVHFEIVRDVHKPSNQTIYNIGEDWHHFRKPAQLKIDHNQFSDKVKGKSGLARMDEKGIHPIKSEWRKDSVVADIYAFGNFIVYVDSLPPTIAKVNRLSQAIAGGSIVFNVSDNLQGPFPTVEASINGQWVLLENDPKRDEVKFKIPVDWKEKNFDIQLTASDHLGNSRTEIFPIQLL